MGKSYDEYRKEAEKSGAGENLTERFVTFKEPGDAISGAYLYEEQTTPNEEMGPCNRYVYVTPDGISSCLLGGANDKQIAGKQKKGDLVTITYRGKQPIHGGKHQVNVFDVRRWGHMSPTDLDHLLKDIAVFGDSKLPF